MKTENLDAEIEEFEGAFEEVPTRYSTVDFEYEGKTDREEEKIESSVANEYADVLRGEVAGSYEVDILGHHFDLTHMSRGARNIHAKEGTVFVPENAMEMDEIEESVEGYMRHLEYGEASEN